MRFKPDRNTFFNQTLPSSIGGDAVRLWLVPHAAAARLARRHLFDFRRSRDRPESRLAVIVVASLPWEPCA